MSTPTESPSADAPSTAHAKVCQAVLDVAPDLQPDDLDREADLQLDLGLDSIDLVNVAGAIKERTGVEIPEVDFAPLRRVGDLADYVESHGK